MLSQFRPHGNDDCGEFGRNWSTINRRFLGFGFLVVDEKGIFHVFEKLGKCRVIPLEIPGVVKELLSSVFNFQNFGFLV